MTDDHQTIAADYAVLGVGALAEAIVVGLSDGRQEPPTIVLSPRGHDRAARLSARFANVEIATDNQAAVSAGSTVLVCLRPQDAERVLETLSFRPDHRVVSVMARYPLADVSALVAPASDVVRAIPNPAVAQRQGVTPVFPGGSGADALFEVLGGALVLAEEHQLVAASVASAVVATHLATLQVASQWLAEHGLSADDSGRYIASIFAGVGSELRGVTDLEPLVASHATQGGLNERVERTMREAGFFERLNEALDDLHGSVS